MTLRAKVTYRPKVSSWKSEPSCKKKTVGAKLSSFIFHPSPKQNYLLKNPLSFIDKTGFVQNPPSFKIYLVKFENRLSIEGKG